MAFTVTIPNLKAARSNAVAPLVGNYISGTGTAGADNTAQNVLTVVVPADTMRQVGDRIRARAYWRGDTGSPITITMKLNTVTTCTTIDGGAATLFVCEAWLHYVDATHANIIDVDAGGLGASSAANVAGFSWATDQNLIVSQDAIANNHTVVYFLAVDVFPKGF